MGKLRVLIIILFILLFSLAGGLFVALNDTQASLQLLWTADTYTLTVGELALVACVFGFSAALVLCVAHLILQSLELRLVRRKLRQAEKELDGLRNLAAKDTP